MVDRAFVVLVDRLRRDPGSWRDMVLRGPVAPDVVERRGPGDSSVPPGAEAECEVRIEPVPGGVMVSGTVGAPWHGVCRRCTAPVEGFISAEVRERFTEAGDAHGGHPGDDPGDDEAYAIVEDRIDLGALVHDVIVLELPLAPLCGAGCLGLCPTCGVDRNQAHCECGPTRDPRWASLDVLRTSPDTPHGAPEAEGWGSGAVHRAGS